MSYQVLLVDDHSLIRDGIKALIEQSGEFRVIAEAENGIDALGIYKRLSPDVVVVNINSHALNGIEAATQILKTWEGARVLLLSLLDDEEATVTALRSGARGMVRKRASSQDLLDALRIVASGGSYFARQVTEHPTVGLEDEAVTQDDPPPAAKRLTARELEVLRLVTTGQTSKEIAERLTLSVETVRSYRKSMMRKLGVKNIATLIHVALREGLSRWTKHVSGTYT
jgi:DNA-binding NarL/FixJ family response regulator